MSGRCSSTKLFALPGKARAALREAQRQRAGRGELAVPALDGELLHPQDVLLERRAQLAALQIDAEGWLFEADRFAAQRSGEDRLAERAANLQIGGEAAFDALLGQQGLRRGAQIHVAHLRGKGKRRARGDAEARSARLRRDVAFHCRGAVARGDLRLSIDSPVGEARIDERLFQAELELAAFVLARG